jgi:lysine 2,3-aminomutase
MKIILAEIMSCMSICYTHWTQKHIRKQFAADFPQLCEAAGQSVSAAVFREKIKTLFPDNDTLARLVEFDGQTITDFSTGNEVPIQTMTLLYHFLQATETEAATEAAGADLLIDLYFLFCKAAHKEPDDPVTDAKVMQWSKHWPSGVDPTIQQAREESKQRIIRKLISRLGRRHSISTPYFLPDFWSFEEKQRQIEEWWSTNRFHLHLVIKNPDELNFFLDNTLSEETMQILHDAKKKGIPFFVTPYYLSLLDITGQTFDDAAIRSYILYTSELVETFGEIKAWEKEDEVEPGRGNAAGWILPEGRNIHRRYPEVAILIPDSIGRACGGLCASCQRMYDFQSKRLNFNLKELAPKESWPSKLKKLTNYFEEDTQLRDILITGGDALMSRNATLRNIFEAIYKMALQKKIANEHRPDGEKFAEIQRIRLGTRLLAYLPMRVDEELISILKIFRDKASKIGVKQFFIQTHFQSPLEMTKEAREAIRRITSVGWIITNQLVYNVAASRRGHTVKLRKTLINNGVIPYYTFTVKGFHENYAVYAPIARSMQERAEEKVYGVLNDAEQSRFVDLLQTNIPYTKAANLFLQEHKRPFAATDRSVLNLPGIGKSMTFRLIGITKAGKRILCFDHDMTRRHSPVVQTFGHIYITENKSILAYLKQLERLGENVKSYQSIWEYTEGITEPKFKLYEYPDLQFHPTGCVNHLA